MSPEKGSVMCRDPSLPHQCTWAGGGGVLGFRVKGIIA